SAATPAAALPATTSGNAGPAAMPRLVADASPRYPLPALNRKIEGSVEVSFTILPDGRVGAPRLVSSEPAGVFDAAALAAVARLRFEASGQSHAARRTLNFRLPSR
ncbi:TonB family protein, partial [Lysobacter sp. 1R34A]|uniref:TonB family protein n=1 Tax=Lysobacter sp. 1R34A TaxID=3445786 RepID=UPI003EECB556